MKPANPNPQYLGKYRGTVLNNVDPEQRGRLTLNVPDALGEIPSSWAEPCVPLAGPAGPPLGIYFVPAIGTGVWVEFEHGDPTLPIWSGCRWGSQASVPSTAKLGNPADPNIVIQSLLQALHYDQRHAPDSGHRRHYSPGTTGAKIVVNDSGIYIDNGKGASVQLIGATVLINQTALTVT